MYQQIKHKNAYKSFTPYPTRINSGYLKISKSDPVHQQDKEEETNDCIDQCKQQQHLLFEKFQHSFIIKFAEKSRNRGNLP